MATAGHPLTAAPFSCLKKKKKSFKRLDFQSMSGMVMNIHRSGKELKGKMVQ